MTSCQPQSTLSYHHNQLFRMIKELELPWDDIPVWQGQVRCGAKIKVWLDGLGFISDLSLIAYFTYRQNCYANLKPVSGSCLNCSGNYKSMPLKEILRSKLDLRGIIDCVATAKINSHETTWNERLKMKFEFLMITFQ